MVENGKQKQDVFAEIGTLAIRNRDSNLVMPGPPKLDARDLPMQDGAGSWELMEKLDSADKLHTALADMRSYYAPFMQDLAPPLDSFRWKHTLTSFWWRVQLPEDRLHFQEVLAGKGPWQQVTVPHYGGPLGKAVTYYRTTMQLTAAELAADSIFLCFKGVDYKARVYMNGVCLGEHEGFFAPFEFDCTGYMREGTNELFVQVENDYIYVGNESEQTNGKRYSGDKLYAATGPGYDDPEFGWHHCPPGMGIYQEVYLESRPTVHLQDLFIRPLPEQGQAEAWIEVGSTTIHEQAFTLELSVYGQNFTEAAIERLAYSPATTLEVGLSDTLTEAEVKAAGKYQQPIPLYAEKGHNLFKVMLSLSDARIWEPDTPWLYQLQVRLLDGSGQIVDTGKRQFGLRSFYQDENSEPKGKFYLNGREIRLRGTNTMGHEQQCVMKEDWDQLRDDLLLAKLCHMNFLRLTQRPVQQEVYDYCDRLGLMVQTDLPLFGVLRRNKFSEAIRQAEEMERLVRSHPSNIMVTYINEPFPNAGNKPHRHLSRSELEHFFEAADLAVRLQNPDRVIKHVDGDYDPPSKGMPDNHCYPYWYNGHGIDVGLLHKGYWIYVKPGWHYGCGEFGAEGLEDVATMRKYYPAAWLPQHPDEEGNWSPNAIIGAQTGRFHYFFYDTPSTLAGWIAASQDHQAWATRMMAEAFRRDAHMNTFAIHLFIDAFPSGWMKTIMDVDRNPKPAYYAYREALSPLSLQLRTDRQAFWGGEEIAIEAWLCNDTSHDYANSRLHYQVELGGQVVTAGMAEALVPLCGSQFQGHVRFRAMQVDTRTPAVLRLGMRTGDGQQLQETHMALDIWPAAVRRPARRAIHWLGPEGADMPDWMSELQVQQLEFLGNAGDGWDLEAVAASEDESGESGELGELGESGQSGEIIIVADYSAYERQADEVQRRVELGAAVVFLELGAGKYELCGSEVTVKPCGMMPLHFASRNTGHELVAGMQPGDFKMWYDASLDRITPLLSHTFEGEGFRPILTSGNKGAGGQWIQALAAAEKACGHGRIIICQLHLNHRVGGNPAAWQFIDRLIGE